MRGAARRFRWRFANDVAQCCGAFLPRGTVPTFCAAQPRFAKSSPEIAVQHADARGLCDGLIWPKTGFASIVLAATPLMRLFSPGLTPIPREARKSHQRRPPRRFGPKAGASPIVLGLSIAIEAAVV